MKAFMESQKDPSAFMQSNHAGVQRVLDSDGQYAFLMESNSIQYQTERNCDLVQVGKLLDSKGYGIAFTPGNLIIQILDEITICKYRISLPGANIKRHSSAARGWAS